MSQKNDTSEIVMGLITLLGMHLISAFLIFLLGLIVSYAFTGYAALYIWIYGGGGFFLVQLLYVIPLVLLLKRQGKTARMKGVIIGAVITALLNGACFLSFYR
jgi:hypothetical protein